METMEDPVEEHRRYIDRIDRTIVALLEERMRRGKALGDLKRERRWPVRSAEREADVMTAVRTATGRHLTPVSAERIFSLIIEETSAVQGDR